MDYDQEIEVEYIAYPEEKQTYYQPGWPAYAEIQKVTTAERVDIELTTKQEERIERLCLEDAYEQTQHPEYE
jgi:hypothetical protein